MVSDVRFTAGVPTTTQQESQALAQDFDDFLVLLTTQLQNQDPTAPLETEEFTNQLVQFSQVEQQISTNEKLDELIAFQLVDPLSDATDFVGLSVSYEGSEFFFDGDNSSDISYSLNDSAAETEIIISDEFGQEVFRASGRTSPGSHNFVWDGIDNQGTPVPPGTYQVEIEAVDRQGEDVFSATLVQGIVRGVETDGLNTFLLVGERAIPQSQVLRLEQPLSTSNNQASEPEDGEPASNDASG